MFGKKAQTDRVSVREYARKLRLEDKSYAAFARGDVFGAMELGRQAAAIGQRELAEYRRTHPYSPRYSGES